MGDREFAMLVIQGIGLSTGVVVNPKSYPQVKIINVIGKTMVSDTTTSKIEISNSWSI